MNDLRHYGIKGMKWGVRRYQNPDGSYTKEGLRRRNRQELLQIRKDRTTAYKNRSRLSNKELDDRIRRLEKETRLKKLTQEEYSSGRNVAVDMLKQKGSKIVISALAGLAIAGGRAFLSKKGVSESAISMILPNPNKNK